MQRYFFNLDGEIEEENELGAECSSVSAAKALAVRTFGAMIQKTGRECRPMGNSAWVWQITTA